MAENKVRYGLKNVHYAVATEGTDGALTYTTPVRYPGAVSLTLDPRGETSEFYADDRVYYATTSNNGYEALQGETNWFDAICEFIGSIFGG